MQVAVHLDDAEHEAFSPSAYARSGFGWDDPVAGLTALAGAIASAARKASAKNEPVTKAASAQADQKAAMPAAKLAKEPARVKAG